MASSFEKTVTATEFKAKCLELIELLHNGKLRRLHVTKRGKPFVTVTNEAAPQLVEDAAWDGTSIFGCMKGWVSPIPADHDWEKPLFTDEELDGFEQNLIDQVDGNFDRRAA